MHVQPTVLMTTTLLQPDNVLSEGKAMPASCFSVEVPHWAATVPGTRSGVPATPTELTNQQGATATGHKMQKADKAGNGWGKVLLGVAMEGKGLRT